MPQLTLHSFVRDLPSGVRQKLGRMLDFGNSIERLICIIPRNPDMLFQNFLSVDLRYSEEDVLQLRLRPSKTQFFLKDWGTQNCQMRHLIKALLDVQLIEAALYLQRDVLKLELDPEPPCKPLPIVSQREPTPQRESTPSREPTPERATPEREPIPSRATPEREPISSRATPQRELTPSREPEESQEDEPLLEVSYEWLKSITDNFNQRHLTDGGTLIDTGGFGDVFLGTYPSAFKVAVKRMKNNTEVDWKQFETEIKTLCVYKHENLVTLLSYSKDGERQCLVYQYMVNGSLEDRLARKHGTPVLTVSTRVEIATGTCKGIAYLHSKGVIHRDIKSANILLDADFKPKVGDFATARVAPIGMSTMVVKASAVIGTQPYLAPESMDFNIHPGLDVYSFGVVLLELITGLPILDHERVEVDLRRHVVEYCTSYEDEDDNHVEGGDIYDLRDKYVTNNWNRTIFQNLYNLSKKCMESSKLRRKKIYEVLEMLQNVHDT